MYDRAGEVHTLDHAKFLGGSDLFARSKSREKMLERELEKLAGINWQVGSLLAFLLSACR